MEEIWKDIKGYEGFYQVSNLGRVKSFDRIVKSRFKTRVQKGIYLKTTDIGGGYLRCTLMVDKKKKQFFIHRLVAGAFIPNPENKPEIHHINHNPSDNCVDNLMWVTRKGQMDNHHNKQQSKSALKYASSHYPSIVLNGIKYNTQSEASRILNINRKTLGVAIKNGKKEFNSRGNHYIIG